MPEINIRTDWVKEFSKNLFVTGDDNKNTTTESDHPLIDDDYLKSAKYQLGITT